jgi:outer membrane protein OmpA-like peptidoglycan-associated protein
MRQTIIVVIAVALVGCAQTQRDLVPRNPEQIDAEIDAATAKAENPPPETETSRVYVDEKIIAACGIMLPQAFFEFESAKLGESDKHELHAVAECLDTGALKDTKIGVVGHADPRGTGETNAELGMDRAEAVADYLVQHGVEPDRVTMQSVGETMASTDPDDWPANRRVDLILRSSPN